MKYKKRIKIVISIFLILFAINHVLKNYIFPIKFKDEVIKSCEEHNIDPYLVFSIIKAESKFDKEAVSNKGAKGLMQITPSTGKWISEQMKLENYSEDKLFEEEYNIDMGCWYLEELLDEFGDLDLAIISYNAGRGIVKKWLNDDRYSKDGINIEYIPYEETKDYLDKVKFYYVAYNKIYK